MHSSLSFTSARDKAVIKRSDFRKDIIMPTIYSLDNYEFIKNISASIKPERKVITVKKARLQSVVETIVSKKEVQVVCKPAYYKHRLERPTTQCRRRSLSSNAFSKPSTLVMDVDQRINQKAIFYEESNSNQKQKIKQIKQKLKEVAGFTGQNFGQQQANFYITQVSPKKKKVKQIPKNIFVSTSIILTPQRIYKGYVQEHEQTEKRRQLRNKKQVNTHPIMTIKPRPKTAGQKTIRQNRPLSGISQNLMNPKQILFRSNSLMNTKLSRFQQGCEVLENIKLNNKNSHYQQKFKNFLNTVQSNCLQNNLTKNGIISELNKLGIVWKSQKQFLEAQQNRTIIGLSNDALTMIKSIRNNSANLHILDEQFIENKQQLKFPSVQQI